jgi:hypothetical protein
MFKKSIRAFTLIEVIIYSAILVTVSTVLVSILSITTRIAGTENASSEIANQGNFIIQTIQRLVRESSAVEVSGDSKALSIYLSSYDTSPVTVVFDSVNKKVNLTDASGISALNIAKVKVDSLVFKKLSNAGALDVIGIDLTLSFNSTIPGEALTRTLSTAVSRANAATFDSALFPNTNGSLDVGASGTRWGSGYFTSGNFSGNLTVAGTITGGLSASAGSPPPTDCDADNERGKMAIDTSNNRLYVCNGATRGWDYIALSP